MKSYKQLITEFNSTQVRQAKNDLENTRRDSGVLRQKLESIFRVIESELDINKKKSANKKMDKILGDFLKVNNAIRTLQNELNK